MNNVTQTPQNEAKSTDLSKGLWLVKTQPWTGDRPFFLCLSHNISYAFIPCVPYVTMANTVVLVVSITIIASSVAIYKVFFLTRCVVH